MALPQTEELKEVLKAVQVDNKIVFISENEKTVYSYIPEDSKFPGVVHLKTIICGFEFDIGIKIEVYSSKKTGISEYFTSGDITIKPQVYTRIIKDQVTGEDKKPNKITINEKTYSTHYLKNKKNAIEIILGNLIHKVLIVNFDSNVMKTHLDSSYINTDLFNNMITNAYQELVKVELEQCRVYKLIQSYVDEYKVEQELTYLYIPENLLRDISNYIIEGSFLFTSIGDVCGILFYRDKQAHPQHKFKIVDDSLTEFIESVHDINLTELYNLLGNRVLCRFTNTDDFKELIGIF